MINKPWSVGEPIMELHDQNWGDGAKETSTQLHHSSALLKRTDSMKLCSIRNVECELDKDGYSCQSLRQVKRRLKGHHQIFRKVMIPTSFSMACNK